MGMSGARVTAVTAAIKHVPLLPVLSGTDMLFTMCNLSIGEQVLTLTLPDLGRVGRATESKSGGNDTVGWGLKVRVSIRSYNH